MFAYHERVPGVPEMKIRPPTLWNQISTRRGCPELRPVVVMSMVRSRSRACLMSESELRVSYRGSSVDCFLGRSVVVRGRRHETRPMLYFVATSSV